MSTCYEINAGHYNNVINAALKGITDKIAELASGRESEFKQIAGQLNEKDWGLDMLFKDLATLGKECPVPFWKHSKFFNGGNADPAHVLAHQVAGVDPQTLLVLKTQMGYDALLGGYAWGSTANSKMGQLHMLQSCYDTLQGEPPIPGDLDRLDFTWLLVTNQGISEPERLAYKRWAELVSAEERLLEHHIVVPVPTPTSMSPPPTKIKVDAETYVALKVFDNPPICPDRLRKMANAL